MTAIVLLSCSCYKKYTKVLNLPKANNIWRIDIVNCKKEEEKFITKKSDINIVLNLLKSIRYENSKYMLKKDMDYHIVIWIKNEKPDQLNKNIYDANVYNINQNYLVIRNIWYVTNINLYKEVTNLYNKLNYVECTIIQ